MFFYPPDWSPRLPMLWYHQALKAYHPVRPSWLNSMGRITVDKVIRHAVVLLVIVGGILMLGDALAIDGNYSAPYASQWDSRRQVAALPLETLFGALLIVFNLLAAGIIFIRGRKRQTS